MHVGFLDSPFVPIRLMSKLCEPFPLIKFQIARRILISSVSKTKGNQIGRSEYRQGFTLTQKLGWSFFLRSTPPTKGTVGQSHYVEMSPQGVISS